MANVCTGDDTLVMYVKEIWFWNTTYDTTVPSEAVDGET
jgi:hypothetical protein